MKKQVRFQFQLYLLSSFLFFGNIISGQGIYDEPEARNSAKTLSESVLIVRLPVNGPKIRFLSQKIKNTTDEKIKNQLQSQLDAAEALNLEKLNAIRNALKEYYTISPFLIMPDSSYTEFLKQEKDVFIGENGVVDPAIELKFDDYFFLITGENDDQWVLVDKNLMPEDRPFPHRATVFLSGLRRAFAREVYYKKQIKWFNVKLKALL